MLDLLEISIPNAERMFDAMKTVMQDVRVEDLMFRIRRQARPPTPGQASTWHDELYLNCLLREKAVFDQGVSSALEHPEV